MVVDVDQVHALLKLEVHAVVIVLVHDRVLSDALDIDRVPVLHDKLKQVLKRVVF